jgi:hypothetical protein
MDCAKRVRVSLRHSGKDEQEAISKCISTTASPDNTEENRHVA